MPLAPLDFLAGFVALFTRQRSRLNTLAVQAGGGWVYFAPCLASRTIAQRVMDALPGAAFRPATEVAVHRLPWRKIMRQQAPRYASTRDVKDGVEQFPHVDGAGTASRNCVRQQILDYLPAFLVEVGRVAFDAFAVTFFASHFKNGI